MKKVIWCLEIGKTVLKMYKLTDLYKQLKEEEESTQSPYKIYCDMDGVLTDFDARFRYFGNMDPRAYESKYGKEKFQKARKS